jgi:myo-inositol 2-dehydrogenase/D-chiro-inositol 1-dehydrogenase
MTVSVGVIGTGMIGQDHIRRLARMSGVEVLAVCDADAETAKQVAAGVAARAMPTGEDLIADPSVDAVVVTSSGPTHAEYVLAALAAGKPVFCEKPLATVLEDGERIVRAERAGGRRLVQVGFMRRYDAGYQALWRAVRHGEIGEVLMVHCAHRNPRVPAAYHSEMAVQDTAVHEIDTIRWLLDEEIVTAQLLAPRRTRHRFEHLVDPQIVLFETASGARVDVEVFVNCQYGYDIQCEIVGETGTARLPDPPDAWLRSAGQRRTGVLRDWKDRFTAAFDAELAGWVESVRGGEPTGPSSWDGYAAAAVCAAAVRALHSGGVEPVELPGRPSFYSDTAGT